MESFFLNLGLSWTLSKVMPFIVLLAVGMALLLWVRKGAQRAWIRFAAVPLSLIPVTIYFVFNPIYKGDFVNEYRLEEVSKASIDLVHNRFTVLMIPYCKFCESRIEELKIMKSRVEMDTEFDVLVCTSNNEDLEFYKKKFGQGINVKMVKDLKTIVALAEAQFPTFVFADNMSIHVWSNSQFGTRAKDDVESNLLSARPLRNSSNLSPYRYRIMNRFKFFGS